MNKFFLITLVSLTAISCVKHEVSKKEIKMPKTPKADSYKVKTSGHKCDLQLTSGETQNIFVRTTKNTLSTTVSFSNFITTEKISLLSGSIDGHTLNSVKLIPTETDGVITSTGSGLLTHNNHEALGIDGKILLMTAQVTFDENLNGTIERKMLISSESEIAPSWTELETIAEISNCEKFDAVIN